MVRIAIGFYVDSKHKWSGSSKELTDPNVVSERTGKTNFQADIWSNAKRSVYFYLYLILYKFDRAASLTAIYVDTCFLFVLQGSEFLKEHHCHICLCGLTITV